MSLTISIVLFSWALIISRSKTEMDLVNKKTHCIFSGYQNQVIEFVYYNVLMGNQHLSTLNLLCILDMTQLQWIFSESTLFHHPCPKRRRFSSTDDDNFFIDKPRSSTAPCNFSWLSLSEPFLCPALSEHDYWVNKKRMLWLQRYR